ncbi:hypothetical protein L917_14241, partial [Phytophthora nicotianae]
EVPKLVIKRRASTEVFIKLFLKDRESEEINDLIHKRLSITDLRHFEGVTFRTIAEPKDFPRNSDTPF